MLLTDVNITKSGQTLAELLNGTLISLGLVAILVLGATLLFSVETQVLEKDDSTIIGLVDNLLDLGSDRVGSKGDGLSEKLLKLRNDGLEGVLGVGRSVGTSKVGHEDHGLGAIVDGVLDGGESTDDTLVVGDVLIAVEGNVEVDLKY